MRRFRYDIPYLMFCLLGGAVLMFIVAPLAGMFLNCSPASLSEAASDTEVRASVWLTLWTSMAATLTVSVSAIPLAYWLARKEFFLKRIVTAIIDLPIVIPHTAAGIAILGFVSRGTLAGRAADHLGFRFVGGYAGIMAAMAFVSVPFLVNGARDAFERVPPHLEKAALNLGASPLRVFFTISLPLAWRGVLSGFVLMWARGLSEFGAVVIVAYHPMVTPVLTYERLGSFGLAYARPVSVLFVCICLLLFVTLRLLAGKSQHARR
jgi:molybdate/tungstate transport system permease protein